MWPLSHLDTRAGSPDIEGLLDRGSELPRMPGDMKSCHSPQIREGTSKPGDSWSSGSGLDHRVSTRSLDRPNSHTSVPT